MESKNKNTILNFILFTQLSNWSSYALLGKNLIYTQKYPFEKIGSFLKRNKTQVKIQDGVKYKRATIRVNGNGICLRDELDGREIGTKNQFLIKTNQFLLSKIDARNGAFGVVPEELNNGVITGNFWTFDVDYTKVNPHYLTLLMGTKRFQELSQTASVGTTNRNYLQEAAFINFEIPFPSLEEQDRIVYAYNEKIAQAKELEREAEELEEGIEETICSILGISVYEIDEKNRGLQFMQFSKSEKWGYEFLTKTNKVGLIKFPVKQLKDICTISSGGTPSRNYKEYYNGNIPWIKTGEVVNDVIFDTEEKITKEAVENSSAKIYPKDSLIIAMYGQGATRGRTAKLGMEASTNQACAVLFNIDNGIILTDYLWVYLMNEYERLRAMASGNNQPNLNAGMINSYPIQIPPVKIQQEIIDMYFDVNNKIKQIKKVASSIIDTAQHELKKEIFE